MPTLPQPYLVTVPEAGKLLSVGRTHTYRMINDGLLTVVKVGGGTRITMASIRKFAGVNDNEAQDAGK